jgi:hypothetical protein
LVPPPSRDLLRHESGHTMAMTTKLVNVGTTMVPGSIPS